MVTSTNYYHEEANAEQHANYHRPQHTNDTNEEHQREEGDHDSKYFSTENQIPRNPIDSLRQEATRLEYSAKRLRELANMLESRAIVPSPSSLNYSHAFYLDNGHVSSMQQQQQQQRHQQQLVVDHDEYLGCSPYEAAPLDENGIPKYKGKKRGRKPKKRVRRRNPNAKKRSHTAYTLFVQEMYPKLKQEYEELLLNQPPPQPQHQPNHDGQHHHEKEEQLDDEMDGSVAMSTNPFQSKNIISMIAKQWQEKLPHEKEEWKRKASMLTEESEENQQQQDDEHSVDSEEEGKEDESIAVATVAAAVAAAARHGGGRTSVEDVSRLVVASQEMNEKDQEGQNNEKEGRFAVP